MLTGEWGYFRGDRIEVLVGKDKGKQGFINQVICERNWVIAEGLNWHYRRFGNDEKFPGALIKSEAPLDVSKKIYLYRIILLRARMKFSLLILYIGN